jgi:hypothetical protein
MKTRSAAIVAVEALAPQIPADPPAAAALQHWRSEILGQRSRNVALVYLGEDQRPLLGREGRQLIGQPLQVS